MVPDEKLPEISVEKKVSEEPKRVGRPRAVKPEEPKPRKWEDVAKEIQKLRKAGMSVPRIAEKFELTYGIVNQIMLRSYKMTANTKKVFERHEAKRLGL